MTDRVLIASFAATKGIVVAMVAAALDLQFWKAIVIAVVSGGIGAVGAIVAAVIAARGVRENRELLNHVKRAVGADRREEDRQ